MNDLTSADVRFLIDKEELGPAAQNMFVSVIGAIYKWARERQMTTIEPVKGIARVKGGSHEPWPEHVVEAALADTSPTVRLAVHLLYFTGQRVGDVCAMRWNDITAGAIHVHQQKRGKRVRVPLLSDLAAEMVRTPKRGLTVLADENGKPLNPAIVRRALQSFTAAHGHKTVTHGLRKNAVNSLLEAGCSVAEVASITGQSYAMVEHYAARINQNRLGEAAILKLEQNRLRKPTGKLSTK